MATAIIRKPGRQYTADVFTTGQVAKICRVAPRTVSKWFDSGDLQGYRIPGSQDRRIPRKTLLKFLRAHNMPTEAVERPDHQHVLLAGFAPDLAAEVTARFEGDEACRIRSAATGFEAGALATEFAPDVVLVDLSMGRIEACQVVAGLKGIPHIKARYVAINAGDARHDVLMEAGFVEVFAGQPDAATLAEEIALSRD